MSSMNRRAFILLTIPIAATGCVGTRNQVKSPSHQEEIPPNSAEGTEEVQTEHLDEENQERADAKGSKNRNGISEHHQAHLRQRRKARQLQLEKSRKRRVEAARKRRRRLKAARDRRRKRKSC